MCQLQDIPNPVKQRLWPNSRVLKIQKRVPAWSTLTSRSGTSIEKVGFSNLFNLTRQLSRVYKHLFPTDTTHLSVFTLDGDKAHGHLLQFALHEDNLQDTTVMWDKKPFDNPTIYIK